VSATFTPPALFTLPTPDYAAIKARQQSTWASGDYAMIATTINLVSELLCETANISGGERVLDVACGTGDLTRAFADAGPARVVGLDFTREMLDVAEMKQKRDPTSHGDRITYIEGDAQQLPFADAAFDIVSIAFGIRNVADPAKAIAEFFRVLRPGGRLVILEFDKIRIPVVGWVSDFYTRRIMPHTATLISGDRSGAYKYLPASVETFLDREQLGGVLRQTGFSEVSAKPLTMGVCICHRGVKPVV